MAISFRGLLTKESLIEKTAKDPPTIVILNTYDLQEIKTYFTKVYTYMYVNTACKAGILRIK